MLRMTILCNNYVRRARLLAEHGLSLWIEMNDQNILFDTGQTDVWLKNARTLGVEPESASAIILSHGHYDHCGGLSSFPFCNSKAKIYVSEQAFERKLARNDKGVYREIGMPWKPGETPESSGRVVHTKGVTEILSGVWTLGQIGSYHAFEPVQNCFFTEKNGEKVPDTMEDEQILVVRDGNGLAVFSGCSHRGIVNCLEHVRRCFPDIKIKFLAAGMHLSREKENRIKKTEEYLVQSELEVIVPLHCTGIPEASRLKMALGDRCILGQVGDRINLF
ncbi:MAG: MBL fold metallo-hydrolase [Oscillospiraceae bacterium]|nr:MBL fold metallo-hydrolase [Oscillospiraceae bacterium]